MKARIAASLFVALQAHAHANTAQEAPAPEQSMRDVNRAGDMVGEISDSHGKRRAVLSRQGRLIELGTLGGDDSYATGINDDGAIIGASLDAANAWHAFLYLPGLGMRDLGTLGGRGSHAVAIGRTGLVVGYADVDNSHYHAFLYDGRRMTDLGTLGGKTSHATSVNASGQVVGAAQDEAGHRRAFVYHPLTGMRALPTLGGQASTAMAINDAGVVVGAAATAGGRWHAFLYDGKRMTDLGALVSWGNSYATGISRDGKVVGTIRSCTAASHSFVYEKGVLRVLPPLTDGAGTAKITEDGEIVGAVRAGRSFDPVIMRTGQRTDAPWKPVDWLTFFTLLPIGLFALWHVARDLRDWLGRPARR